MTGKELRIEATGYGLRKTRRPLPLPPPLRQPRKPPPVVPLQPPKPPVLVRPVMKKTASNVSSYEVNLARGIIDLLRRG